MSFEFRLPNITAADTEGKIAQIQSSLYQLIQNLNWAFNSLNLDGVAENVLSETTNQPSPYSDSVVSNANVARREVDELKTHLKTSSDAVEIGSTVGGAYNSYAQFEEAKISLLRPTEITPFTIGDDDTLEGFARDCNEGITFFSYSKGVGTVMKNDGMINMNIFLFTGEIAVNTYNKSTWSGWKYLEPVQKGE